MFRTCSVFRQRFIVFVLCILHTAYAQLDNRCIAPPRMAQAPEKEYLPCIVGPPGMRALRTPAL